MTKQTLIILKQLTYAEIQDFKGIKNKYIQKYITRLERVYRQVEKELATKSIHEPCLY